MERAHKAPSIELLDTIFGGDIGKLCLESIKCPGHKFLVHLTMRPPHDASCIEKLLFCILYLHFVKNVLYGIDHSKTSYNVHDYGQLFVQSVSIYNVLVQ